MGLDPHGPGATDLYRIAASRSRSAPRSSDGMLALTAEERTPSLPRVRPDAAGADRSPDRRGAREHTTLETRPRRPGAAGPRGKTGESPQAPAPAAGPNPSHAGLGVALSAWIIAPLVFLFLLRDTGEIKRAAPGRPERAVRACARRAGRCRPGAGRLLARTLPRELRVRPDRRGVPGHRRRSDEMGHRDRHLFRGGNVVPYMGFAAALLSGMAYALLAEGVRPLLPCDDRDVPAVGGRGRALAELLKNLVYEPFVLGGAVKLHPLVV